MVKNNMLNYIILFGLAGVGGLLYYRFQEKQNKNKKKHTEYGLLEKYMASHDEELKMEKPILWIYIPQVYNSRKWENFYSRSNTNLNTPYLSLTIESIVKHCSNSFQICFIDETSFEKLIPDWQIDLTTVGDPVKNKLIYLGILKLIYLYGGYLVPKSFLCFKDLNNLLTDKTISFYDNQNKADSNWIGAPKNSEVIYKFINYMEGVITADYTQTSIIEDLRGKWIQKNKNKIQIYSNKLIGRTVNSGKPLFIEEILSTTANFKLDPESYGIYLNDEEILKRRYYNWFCYLSPNEILESQLYLVNYFNKALQ